MTSRVVAFRDAVVAVVRAGVPELVSVDWCDGLFDEVDIKGWSLSTPCALVAARRAPSDPHSTGELNCALAMLAVVVVQDGDNGRDADPLCWQILEEIAVLANHSNFGAPDAGPSIGIRFDRLNDPVLRRDGLAIGVVEWTNGLTIGVNAVEAQYLYYDAGRLVSRTPADLTVQATVRDAGGASTRDVVAMPYGDPASPVDREPS